MTPGALLLLTLAAHQATGPDCSRPEQLGWPACAQADLVFAQAMLDGAYVQAQAAMRVLDGTAGPGRSNIRERALVDAQDRWLGYRQAQCALQALRFANPEMAAAEAAGCAANMARERTRQLTTLAVSMQEDR